MAGIKAKNYSGKVEKIAGLAKQNNGVGLYSLAACTFIAPKTNFPEY